jgi:hypothetical protein
MIRVKCVIRTPILTAFIFYSIYYISLCNLLETFSKVNHILVDRNYYLCGLDANLPTAIYVTCTRARRHPLQTDFHASANIRTHNPSRLTAANQRSKSRAHWDCQFPSFTSVLKLKFICTLSIIM